MKFEIKQIMQVIISIIALAAVLQVFFKSNALGSELSNKDFNLFQEQVEYLNDTIQICLDEKLEINMNNVQFGDSSYQFTFDTYNDYKKWVKYCGFYYKRVYPDSLKRSYQNNTMKITIIPTIAVAEKVELRNIPRIAIKPDVTQESENETENEFEDSICNKFDKKKKKKCIIIIDVSGSEKLSPPSSNHISDDFERLFGKKKKKPFREGPES